MTDTEKHIVGLLGEIWGMFLTLPVEHSDDINEFRHAIHGLQCQVLARAGRREINSDEFDPAKWQGWTERGKSWLAAGCPPLNEVQP